MTRKVLIQDTEANPVQSYENTPDLAAVLASGNDTGGIEFTSNPEPDAPALAALSASASGTGQADANATAAAEDGDANASSTATTSGAGGATAKSIATSSGSGFANVEAVATTVTGAASAGALAVRGAVTAGIYAEVDGAGVARLGFNAVADSGGIPIPEIGNMPDAQEIVTILVDLGLITQAA